MTEKDVLVINRIVGLLQNGPRGKVEMAILANNPESLGEAADFVAFSSRKQYSRDLQVSASQVNPSELAATDTDVIIIPDGFDQSQLDMVFAIAQEKKIVTISTSDACLKAQRCAISFESNPAVNIHMSQTAAAETNVSFAPTLRMMIKEVP